jgi:FkbM family methyltransferase
MTPIRKTLKKWLYGTCPGFAGKFNYFGVEVYFPKKSEIFRIACDQGIYESAILQVLQSQIKPYTTFFDIGANIGLLAIPVLKANMNSKVISVEASPSTLPYLIRTAENSEFQTRWQVLGKAMSNYTGEAEYNIFSPDKGAYDGFSDTARGGQSKRITVAVTSLDVEWMNLGKPRVSAIKIDVEGAELQVLEGACECILHDKPSIVLEWAENNLRAYNRDFADLLEVCKAINYGIFSIPSLVQITSKEHLKINMALTENFILLPL